MTTSPIQRDSDLHPTQTSNSDLYLRCKIRFNVGLFLPWAILGEVRDVPIALGFFLAGGCAALGTIPNHKRIKKQRRYGSGGGGLLERQPSASELARPIEGGYRQQSGGDGVHKQLRHSGVRSVGSWGIHGSGYGRQYKACRE